MASWNATHSRRAGASSRIMVTAVIRSDMDLCLARPGHFPQETARRSKGDRLARVQAVQAAVKRAVTPFGVL
jgi:hypothetical protein